MTTTKTTTRRTPAEIARLNAAIIKREADCAERTGHITVTTRDGYGAYCKFCGTTLA